MVEITRILAANIYRQFPFVITTTASTRCLVRNFQLIWYSQGVNATSQLNTTTVVVQDVQNGRTMLAPCTRNKRLQRKVTKDYYWIGVQENIGMFSKS